MGEGADFETPFPSVDAEEQMRAVLSKLMAHCTSLDPGDDSCTKEHALDMVKIRSVEAGRFVFDLWYEPARTLPRPSTDTPQHPLASDGSASPFSSDPYIPIPSTQVELGD